jgi:outer membrane protein
VPFKQALLLTDISILEAFPRGREFVSRAAPDVAFNFLGHDGVNHDLLNLVGEGTEAILLGGLPRLPEELFQRLLSDLADRRIPVFSLVSEAEVRRGALASDAVQADFVHLARRNALNMQAVMLGGNTADQPIYFDGKRQLAINMDTARRIGLSPRFDVLSEAELINPEPQLDGPALELKHVAQLAVENNLDLAVSRMDVEIGDQNVLAARSNLLPQISLGTSYTGRRDQKLLRSAASPEGVGRGSVTLGVPVYSESATSGYQQQRHLQRGRQAGFEVERLDRVLESTTAYLQALRADTQKAIQQDNLKLTKSNLALAEDRVRVGSASNADIYRWQANLASARSAVLSALAVRNQAYENLNRVLNRPIDTPLKLAKPRKNEPFTMPAEEFDKIINNPRRFGWFIEFYIEYGLAEAPELLQLQTQIDAAERDIVARRRAYWLPEVTLQAQYLDSFDANGRGSGSAFDSANDWNISLNANLPLFTGGARRSELSRSRLQRTQLSLQKAATAQRIEQNIRKFLHSAQASYVNIHLSEQGAEASRKNLELVSDAYRQGAVSIIDLLDAQSQSLSADLSASNAIHDFLIDIMNVQRATRSFDFLEPPEIQAQRTQEFLDYIERRASTPVSQSGE